jgi:hypothetical protein
MSPLVTPVRSNAADGNGSPSTAAPITPGDANPARKNERRVEDRPNRLICMISSSYFGRLEQRGIGATPMTAAPTAQLQVKLGSRGRFLG